VKVFSILPAATEKPQAQAAREIRRDASSLLNHCVGVVVVDRFIVLRLDPIPFYPAVFIGHGSDITDQIFDEHRALVGALRDRFFVRPLQ
jgi:hypothetical protein